MNIQKQVILHVDDIWSTLSANRAAFAFLSQGLATSWSVMIPSKTFSNFMQYDTSGFDMWVHLTLTSEWENTRNKRSPTLPISEVPSLVDPDWFFRRTIEELYRHCSLKEVYLELSNQIRIAQKVWLQVSHIDSHMGSLLHKKLFPIYSKLAIDFNIQPFICLPRATDTLWNWFYDCDYEINALVQKGFKVLDHFDSNSLYMGDNYMAHCIERIKNIQKWSTYFILHLLDKWVNDNEKPPDYQARQNEYNCFWDPIVQNFLTDLDIDRISFVNWL